MGLPMKCSLISVSGACSPQVGQLRETSVPERKPDRTTGPRHRERLDSYLCCGGSLRLACFLKAAYEEEFLHCSTFHSCGRWSMRSQSSQYRGPAYSCHRQSEPYDGHTDPANQEEE